MRACVSPPIQAGKKKEGKGKKKTKRNQVAPMPDPTFEPQSDLYQVHGIRVSAILLGVCMLVVE